MQWALLMKMARRDWSVEGLPSRQPTRRGGGYHKQKLPPGMDPFIGKNSPRCNEGRPKTGGAMPDDPPPACLSPPDRPPLPDTRPAVPDTIPDVPITSLWRLHPCPRHGLTTRLSATGQLALCTPIIGIRLRIAEYGAFHLYPLPSMITLSGLELPPRHEGFFYQTGIEHSLDKIAVYQLAHSMNKYRLECICNRSKHMLPFLVRAHMQLVECGNNCRCFPSWKC